MITADLAWALHSPNILLCPPEGLSGSVVSEHQAQQFFMRQPVTPAFPIPRRLGHYFELLVRHAIQQNPLNRIIAHEFPIFSGKQQLGALDLIFQHQDTLHHWELAVKFYLYHSPSGLWYGPNAQDHLHKKLQRLFTHQLTLAQHETVQASLQHRPLHSAAYIKGYLFYHWQQPAINLPNWISPTHLSGWWCYQYELHDKLASSVYHWLILPRADWLSPACYPSDTQVFDHHEIVQAIGEYPAIPLLVELVLTEHGWMEVTRGFVVPNTWPEPAP